MNLHRLTGYIILIWLPLASLKSHDKIEQPNRKDDNDLVENLSENLEENPVKGRGPGRHQAVSASENFPKKFSANSGKEYAVNNERKVKSAHKLGLNKDSSALNVDNSVGKRRKSAAAYNRRVKGRRRRRKKGKKKRETLMRISLDDDPNDFEDYEEEELEETTERNTTELGSYLGAPCEGTCSERLLHVYCEPKSKVCECEEKYPVQIGVGTGCEKPKQLGDQCFYAETCSFFDSNAECTQINHNAICQCKPGYHTVALRKGVRRMFCSEDIAVVSADLPTLLGVATGIAVLTGLICFVLRLFSGNRYPSTRHYANANIAPPLLLSSDNQWINGIPLTVHGRPPSRASCQRSTMSLAQYSRSKGVMVPASRAGAARAAAILLIPCHLQASRHPDSEVLNNSNNDDADVQQNEVEHPSRLGSRRHSFSSVHSTTSSQKSMSYSARRFEQENQQKEQRAAMRAAREEAAKLATPLTPSPMSTDGLIPPSKEDPLCFQSEEPPALSITKGNTPVPTTSSK